MRLSGSAAVAVVVLVGCTTVPGVSDAPARASGPTAAVLPSDQFTPEALPIDQSILPVSAADPGQEAAKVLAKCNIGEQIPLDKVTGMGKVPSASDLGDYVPLTGREPQLKEAGPAWVVTISADLPQPGSTELWSNPTCVVTDGEAGYYATGPVTDLATGKTTFPEKPASQPELRVPPLAP